MQPTGYMHPLPGGHMMGTLPFIPPGIRPPSNFVPMSAGLPAGMPPPLPGMPHRLPPSVVPGVLPGVVVAAAAPSSISPAATALSLFNSQNSQCVFINPTCELLNRHLFSNPMAGLPVTLCVRNVPLDLEDTMIVKIFEICGKLARVVRPSDPKSLLPSSLVFVTYAQAVCAMRALDLVSNVCINDRNDKLEVLAGSKERSLLHSVKLSEQDAAKLLPSGMTVDDVENPIRRALESLLRPPPDLTIPKLSTSEDKGMNYLQFVQSNSEALAEHGAHPALIDVVDKEGEKFLLNEIGKFRARQQQRDLELAVQRRDKIKAKIMELEAAKIKVSEDGNKEKIVREKEPDSNAVRLDTDDLREVKKRRLQVLESLSGVASEETKQENASMVSVPIRVGLLPPTQQTKKRLIFGGGGEDDEEKLERAKQKEREEVLRKLRLESEQHALQRQQLIDSENSADELKMNLKERSDSKKENPEQKDDRMRLILARVPSEREELLTFAINWRLIDEDLIISTHLRPWVVQKVVEFLGEEEQSLTEFILTKLSSHCTYRELQDELSLVLDADSEVFVLKLWKILVFYSIQCEVNREQKVDK